jgi:hypothetical protein
VWESFGAALGSNLPFPTPRHNVDAMSQIGRRTIIYMVLVAALALVWNVLP